ncbi:MAG TPA: hypothetical protein VFZ72_03145 [Jiangellaceae bacterium]
MKTAGKSIPSAVHDVEDIGQLLGYCLVRGDQVIAGSQCLRQGRECLGGFAGRSTRLGASA